ncbi:MAG: hypothetical protein HFG27_03230 [Provencibacterium sp.]|nr:hypothetical protein [Provencibacterium sp.]
METASLIRGGIGLIGAAAMLAAFWFHSLKRLVIDLAVVWEVLGGLLVITACFPQLSAWTKLLSPASGLLLVCLGAAGLWGAFQFCLSISRLSMQSRELAIQLSLLLQENRQLAEEIERLQLAEEPAYGYKHEQLSQSEI